MATPPLCILGARQNNLTGFDLEIPHDRLVVLTGVSGSGKSSLAFDTVFAEGQWRFLESLPSYPRLLLEKMARPRVDGLENVCRLSEKARNLKRMGCRTNPITRIYRVMSDSYLNIYLSLGRYAMHQADQDCQQNSSHLPILI